MYAGTRGSVASFAFCKRGQPLHRCYADGRTVVLVGARSVGVAIACASNLVTALVGTPGFKALPAYTSGTMIMVMEAYGFILAIACIPCLHCFSGAKSNADAALTVPLHALSVSQMCLRASVASWRSLCAMVALLP